jgi:hypothetical protein
VHGVADQHVDVLRRDGGEADAHRDLRAGAGLTAAACA